MSDSTPRDPRPVSVLFVCLGNICRSTMSEGVFRSLTTSPSNPHPLISTIDSCGTGAYHIGSSPDRRTMATLKANGINDYTHSARRFKPATDLEKFDYIFAMDRDNLEDLMRLRKQESKRLGLGEGGEGLGKVMLFGEFGGKGKGGSAEEVDDPYYGGDDGFEVAYEQAMRFSKAFLKKLEDGELSK
ncbi:low molecular weight phosphotyrosine protein phosphatase [Phaeosphaeria sp. MPI-PUGE-AT-0046c]|nr:low molecular weight phosphotyrosine protein phosphatase [Phaeosphaeria sp. MPI-PUGE-AT-0046c]